MKTSYSTIVIGSGNHASLEIPEKNLAEIKGNKRAPLKVTINGHTYQSTATGVDGKCMVVFPMRDRKVSGASAGDQVMVTLELDNGYRHVDIPPSLQRALETHDLTDSFRSLTYSRRREFARSIAEAKLNTTRTRRIEKVIAALHSKRS